MANWSEFYMTDRQWGSAAKNPSSRPSILIVSPDGVVPVELGRTVSALHLNFEVTSPVAALPAYGGGHSVIWVKVDAAPPAGLIDGLKAALDDGGCSVIFDIETASIDEVWSEFGDRDGVMVLAYPDANEVHAAIASTLAGQSMAVHSEVQTTHQRQLERLQEEVNRIARTLAKMSEPEARLLLRSADGSREPPSPFIEDQLREARLSYAPVEQIRPLGETRSTAPALSAREVRRIIRLRRVRDQFFEPELFADPAWDMLLDLYAARLEHNRVSVSSLCIAAAVPATTALRWIKALTTSGLFERRADPHDGRRIFVALSDSATAAMHAYFAAITDEGAII